MRVMRKLAFLYRASHSAQVRHTASAEFEYQSRSKQQGCLTSRRPVILPTRVRGQDMASDFFDHNFLHIPPDGKIFDGWPSAADSLFVGRDVEIFLCLLPHDCGGFYRVNLSGLFSDEVLYNLGYCDHCRLLSLFEG
jgi:hypothetical protein